MQEVKPVSLHIVVHLVLLYQKCTVKQVMTYSADSWYLLWHAEGKKAAVKALQEGQAMIPHDGSPGQLSVRATNYSAWAESDVETDIDFEEVRDYQKLEKASPLVSQS